MEINTIITKPLKVPRRSSLELLRIICMFFIVAHHFSVHGQYGDMEMSFFNEFIKHVLGAGGKLGVNVYVLISGYFLINSKFNVKRIIKTVLLTSFYSSIIYLIIALSTPGVSLSAGEFFESLFAIKNDEYWFVTCYVAMAILSPFINKLIHALGEKEHIILIVVLLLMQSALPHRDPYFNFSSTAWFITLYIIAGYLRLYPKKAFSNKRVVGILSLVLCTVLGLWSATTKMSNIVCLFTSVVLFLFFNSLNIKTNRIINLISKTTFGIYLIHDNNYLRPILWGKLLNCPFHASLKTFFIFSAVAVVIVFASCSLIELLRIGVCALFKKLFEKLKTKEKKTC